MMDVANKKIIITGATSGMGQFFYKQLKKHNTLVPLVRDRIKGNAILGDESCFIVCDLHNPKNIEESVMKAAEVMDGLDALINCAGICLPASGGNEAIENWEKTLTVNLISPAILMDYSAKQMIKNHTKGSIINISSVYDCCIRTGVPAAYNASKAALSHITKQYACELSRYGIRVNAISTGWFETEMTKKYWEDDPVVWKEMTNGLPMKRAGVLSELMGGINLLLSDNSSYITGHILRIDGGFSVNKF